MGGLILKATPLRGLGCKPEAKLVPRAAASHWSQLVLILCLGRLCAQTAGCLLGGSPPGVAPCVGSLLRGRGVTSVPPGERALRDAPGHLRRSLIAGLSPSHAS